MTRDQTEVNETGRRTWAKRACVRVLMPATLSLCLGMMGAKCNGNPPLALKDVKFWALQTQNLAPDSSVKALMDSSYDMLVIDPVCTNWSAPLSMNFSTGMAVAEIKSSAAHAGLNGKLVLAYVDIANADNTRYYWTWNTLQWTPPRPIGWPSYVLGPNPRSAGNKFEVAFWDPAWKNIVIDGKGISSAPFGDYDSIIDETIRDGFDGVYLAGVDSYRELKVVQAGQDQAVAPNLEMVKFIGEIRAYAQKRKPGFIVVAENAARMIDDAPGITKVIDGLAADGTYWISDATVLDWNNPAGYDVEKRTDHEITELTFDQDEFVKLNIPVFTVDYTVANAADVYTRYGGSGVASYCTRSALSQLTTTPPPGY